MHALWENVCFFMEVALTSVVGSNSDVGRPWVCEIIGVVIHGLMILSTYA